jgi:glycosyltransferase involved in cell wall biosynthesis
MRILFLTDNFPPEVNAPANRTYEHCREWVKEGVEVTVVTCVPNFPKGKVYDGYKNKLFQKEIIDGIKVIRVWSYITANEGFVKRILDYLSYGIMAFFVGLFIKTDLIVATSPQFFTAASGSVLAFFKRKKWVMEVRDLWPESIIAVGAMKRNAVIRFFEWWERRLYMSSDHIIVVTDAFKDKISNRGIDIDKISVIKNGANLDLFKESDKSLYLIKKHQLEKKFIVAYIGTHGMAHGLYFILESIVSIQITNPNILFLFIGDGAEKNNLLEKAQKLNLTNVLFLDSVGKKEVVDYLNLMDAALVNLKSSDTFLTVIPSKIFEAAAVGKPILLGLKGETQKIIEDYQAGLCFIPENRESFIHAVLEISSNETEYLRYKKGCEKLAKDFDRKLIAKRYLQILEKI